MSLRIYGATTTRAKLVDSFTLPALSVDGATPISPNVPTTPVPDIPTVIVTDTTTRYQDMPGMSSATIKILGIPEQNESVRSAAVNTAVAFGLSATLSADTATRFHTNIIQNALSVQPIVTDTVIIPP